MSSGDSLTMMPTDQMFIDRDINNPIVQLNQDTILKAAQLSNLPEVSYSVTLPTISHAVTQLALPNKIIHNSYIPALTPIVITINMTTLTMTTSTSITTQSSTI